MRRSPSATPSSHQKLVKLCSLVRSRQKQEGWIRIDKDRSQRSETKEAEGDEHGNQFLGRYSNQGRTISFPRGNATDKCTCSTGSFYRCARLVTENSRVHVCFLVSSFCFTFARTNTDISYYCSTTTIFAFRFNGIDKSSLQRKDSFILITGLTPQENSCIISILIDALKFQI